MKKRPIRGIITARSREEGRETGAAIYATGHVNKRAERNAFKLPPDFLAELANVSSPGRVTRRGNKQSRALGLLNAERDAEIAL